MGEERYERKMLLIGRGVVEISNQSENHEGEGRLASKGEGVLVRASHIAKSWEGFQSVQSESAVDERV